MRSKLTQLAIAGAVFLHAATAGAQVNVTATAGTAAGSYTTLKDAFDAINLGTHQGTITIGLTGDTTETASAVLNSGVVPPAVYTAVNIAPVGGARTITGSVAGAIIKLNGADNVTIDGRIGGTGRNLTVTNASTATATAAIWLASVVAGNGASNNVVRNLELATGIDTTSSGNNTFGIIMSGTAISTVSNGVDNDNNSFIANRIIRARYGIVTRGTTTDLNINPIVTDNIIGPSAFGPDQISKVGILMQADSGATVSRNTVQFVGCLEPQACTGADRVGIGIGSETWSVTDATTLTSLGYTVTKNVIHDVVEENTFSAIGIKLGTTQAGGATNNLVANNFIYNVRANATSGDQVCGIGISGGNGDAIVNNSISIAGDMDPGAATASTTNGNAIRIPVANAANNANFVVQNNSIYLDASSSSTAALRFYAITLNSIAYVFGTGGLNFNNYYINPANTQLRTGGLGVSTGNAQTTEFATFANWQAALTAPQDAASIQANPLYFSTTADLHLLGASPNINAGTTIAAVTDDIDGQVRPNGPAYDIGADEFYALPGTLQLSSATGSGNEGTTLVATVNRVTGSTGTVGVTATLTNGSATGGAACGAGVDFVNPGPQLLSFADSVVSQPVNVTLCTDGALDPSETFGITLSLPTSGATLGSPSAATATITDVPPPFAGAYTVGSSGTYPSLTNVGGFFEAINLGGASGNVTINITSDLSSELGTNALNEIAGGFTLLIKPSGAPRTITGTNIGALIRLNGADGVTIDGSTTGATASGVIGGNPAIRELTIQNTHVGTSAAVISVGSGSNGAQNDTIRNVNVLGQDPLTTLVGISLGGTTPGTVGTDNDNNRVENCSVKRSIFGIYSAGANLANQNAGTVITMNETSAVAGDRIRRVGIVVFNDNGTQITQNSINGISTNEAFDAIGIGLGTSAVDVTNTTAGGVTNALVARNKIDGVASLSTVGFSAAGITVAGATGGANTVVNNMISGVTAPATSPDMLAGIYVVGATGSVTKIYHNSIAMAGDRGGPVTPETPSFGVAVTGGDPAVELKNNIFYTTQTGSSGGVTAKSYAIGMATTTFVNLDSNYNDFWSTGANDGGFRSGSLGAGAGTDYVDIVAWRTAVSDDANSLEVDPQYVSATDLHIAPASPLIAAGTLLASVTVDFDNQARSDTTRAIGADQVVQAATVVLPTSASVATTTATLGGTVSSDGGGLVTARGVVYSRTALNPNPGISGASVTDVPVAGTIGLFTTGITGLLPGTGYSFKAYAINPAGPSYTSVATFTTLTPFNGPYTVGSGGNYPSLTNAGGIFEAMNAAGELSGNVTINITSDLAGELGTNALNEFTGAFTVLIKPSGAARTITGTNVGALIRLNGADRVTIDGSTTGATATGIGGNAALRELTIQNTNVGTATTVISFGSGTNGAQNNTIRNVNVLGQDPLTTLIGISLGGTTPGTVGTDNDNNRVENCSVKRSKFGIYSSGASVANPNTGTVFTMNETSAVAGDRIRRVGILVFNDNGVQITQNSINGISTNESADSIGIAVGTQGIDSSSVTPGGVTNAMVARNKIDGVASLSAVGFSAAGISVAGTTGGANTIVNNMVSGVTAPATSPDIVAGIYVVGAAGSATRLYHNSIAMTGDRGAVATQMPSFGVAITGADPTVELKNNIFYTTQIASGGGVNAKSYAIGMVTTAFVNLDSNYNDFWSTGANDGGFRSGSLGGGAGTDYADIAAWRTAVSDDANSLEVDPQYVSATDLHIAPASPLIGAGTVLAAVTVDFDNQTRSDTTRAIGADQIVQAATVVLPTSASVTTTTATLGGTVSSDGGGLVTARGVVYSRTAVNPNPDIPGASVTNVPVAGTTGLFTTGITGLLPGTGYSFKAHAITAAGTSYTAVATFTTLAAAPAVTTPTSTSITANGATLGGTVASDGGSVITERGVVYATSAANGAPLIGGTGVTKVPVGGTTGVFTTGVTGLLPATGYSFRAYAINAVGPTYTAVATFTTLAAAPTVTTPSSASVTGSGATLGGNVTSDGGSVLTERGVVYSTTAANSDPLVAGTGVTKVPVSGTTGVFTTGVTGLLPGTSYSLKAYAINAVGTSYTAGAIFTTLALAPTVTTPTSTLITANAATLGGTVASDGGSVITERGVVYATSAANANPQISGAGVTKAVISGTTGLFSSSIGSLVPATAYSFRAYATNAVGTSYSGVATFTTLSLNLINSFTASNVLVSPGGASTLSWSAAAGATLTLNAAGVSGPSGSQVVNPTATTTYTLVATSVSGTESRIVTVQVNDGTASLLVPTITAPTGGEVLVVTGVGFNWTTVPNATGYGIRVFDGTSGNLLFSGSLLGGSSASTLISLPAGSYRFAVRACASGFEAPQCGPYGTTTFSVSPAGPTGAPAVTFPTEGANLSASTQTLTWTAVTPNPALSGLTYEVLLRDLAAGTTALQITVPSPNLSTIFTMKSSTLYELKVRACQAGCGPYSTAVTFAVTLPPIPTLAPTGPSCSVSGGNSLTCNWNSVANADAYQVQVVQAPPAGPGGGALTVAAKQVSATTVTLPVPAGAATVFIAACNGDGCGPNTTVPITAAGPNPSQANIGTPMAGTVVAGPGVLFTWNRVPGDAGSGLYRLFVQDLSRQSTALDVYTTNNFYSAFFKAEGARYDALVVSNPGLPGAVTGPSQGFNVAGASATSPTLVSPPHNSTLPSGNIQLGWSPVPGATLYQYFVAILGQGNASAGGVTPGLLAQVPLTGTGSGTVYSGIVRACPAGATCVAGSDAGWGPWSNAPGGPGVTNFTVIP